MKHTKIPWELMEETQSGVTSYYINQYKKGRRETVCHSIGTQANAEFIVRACNSHDSLVAILEQIIKDVDDCFETSDLRKFYDRMVANAKDTELALKGDKGNQRFIERIIDRATAEGGRK